jgi:hypothetical protein
VVKRDRRSVGAGVDRAGIEHPGALMAGPIDGACEQLCRDPLPAATRPGHEAGDAPHPRVVGWSLGGGRREATGAIPSGHIGARTDLHPADRRPAPIGEQPGRRTCPRRGPGTAAACRRQAPPRSRAAAGASTCTSTGYRRRARRRTRSPDRPTGPASAVRSRSPRDATLANAWRSRPSRQAGSSDRGRTEWAVLSGRCRVCIRTR